MTHSNVRACQDCIALKVALPCADTSVGLWMFAFQVRFFEDMRLCTTQCDDRGVAFLNNMCSGLCNPVPDMYKCHKAPQCRQDVAGPLPYLPGCKGHEQFHKMRTS